MTVDPTKDVHAPGEAFLSGAKTGVKAAAIPASAIGLSEAEPVIETFGRKSPITRQSLEGAKNSSCGYFWRGWNAIHASAPEGRVKDHRGKQQIKVKKNSPNKNKTRRVISFRLGSKK